MFNILTFRSYGAFWPLAERFQSEDSAAQSTLRGKFMALVERFSTRTFEKTEVLLTQDEPPSGLFLIASGEVAVICRDESGGDPLVMSTLGPGDVVGEVATVLRRPASADVVAVHPTVTLHLPKEQFLSVIQDHPSILLELYKLAIERDEDATRVMAEEAREAEDFVLV